MAFVKSLLYLILSGGVSYTLLCVVSAREEDLIKHLPEGQRYQNVDRKQQEQLLKILKRAARVPESMSQENQGNVSSTNLKLKGNISDAEK